MTDLSPDNAFDLETALAASTSGQWFIQETEDAWTLFAQPHSRWPDDTPGDLKALMPDGPPMHARQILKAPKRSREYAEYWPEAADAALIVRARQNAQKLLDAGKPVAVIRNGRWTGVRGHWELADLQALQATFAVPEQRQGSPVILVPLITLDRQPALDWLNARTEPGPRPVHQENL